MKNKIFVVIALITTLFCNITSYALEFSDVDKSLTTYTAISKLSDMGVILGYEDGTFKPGNTVTRSEFCALVTRVENFDKNGYTEKDIPFSDIPNNYWAKSYISFCYENGIIDGMGDGTFNPDGSITFEQAVKILVCTLGEGGNVQSLKNDSWYTGYLETANKLGMLEGVIGKVSTSITRSGVSQMMYNAFVKDAEGVPTVTTSTPIATEPVSSPTPSPETNIIFIDAGHNNSGKDVGAHVGDLKEEDITWQISDKLRAILEHNGFTVKVSRETITSNVENTSVAESLAKRCELANEAKADLFVSIHCNSYDDANVSGTETYYYSESENGKRFAELVQKYLIEETGLADRKVKTANFVVIRDTLMPSILVETGFLSSQTDAAFLTSESGQTKIATAIAKAICEYRGIKYID